MTNGQAEKLSRMRRRPQIATKAERLATRSPTPSTAQPCVSRPTCLSSASSLKPASAMAGKPSRNENRAASSRRKPRKSAAVRVEAKQKGHDDAGKAHNFKRTQRRAAGIERLGEGKARYSDRYRADHDPESEFQRVVGEVSPSKCRQRTEEDAPDVTPEIADDRSQRGELHSGRECRPRVLPAQERGHDAHVGRGRNRHKFGDALDDAEHGHLRITK